MKHDAVSERLHGSDRRSASLFYELHDTDERCWKELEDDEQFVDPRLVTSRYHFLASSAPHETFFSSSEDLARVRGVF